MKTLALRARVFIHCFLVFGYPGETLALVVHILLNNLKLLIKVNVVILQNCGRSLTRFGKIFYLVDFENKLSTRFFIFCR
jgi:hypothetical protein